MKRIHNKETDKRGKKDWRKEWVGSDKSANGDRSCRHGGNCRYCELRRKFRARRQAKNTEDQVED